jgi:hypothetical protein
MSNIRTTLEMRKIPVFKTPVQAKVFISCQGLPVNNKDLWKHNRRTKAHIKVVVDIRKFQI